MRKLLKSENLIKHLPSQIIKEAEFKAVEDFLSSEENGIPILQQYKYLKNVVKNYPDLPAAKFVSPIESHDCYTTNQLLKEIELSKFSYIRFADRVIRLTGK